MGYFWGTEKQAREIAVVIDEQVDPTKGHSYEKGQATIRHGDVVVDGGAHVGVFTRIALNRGASRVIAYEPQGSCVSCLRKTFSREIAEGRVTVIDKAIWEDVGVLQFCPGGSGLGFHPAGLGVHGTNWHGTPCDNEKDGSSSVPATTIDATVKELGLERMDFIKMDIEGSERYALRGAKETIARFSPRIAATSYHLPDDPMEIEKVVREAKPDYDMLVGMPHLGKPGMLFFH